MKKSSILALLVSVLFFSMGNSFAAASEPSPAENYMMFCGSKVQLITYLKSQGQDVDQATDADFAEINETRLPILEVLKSGNKGIQALLDQGSKADTGPFGAILACGLITQLKSEIAKDGCIDLTSGKSIKDNGGIAACDALMKRLPH